MHICTSNLTIIGSDNGLVPGWHQAIIWTNDGILLVGPIATNFSEILIKIHIFSFNAMHLNMSSAKMAAILSLIQCVKNKCNHSGPAFKRRIDNGTNQILTLVVQSYRIIMLAIIICYYIKCANDKVVAYIITAAHTRHSISHDDIIKWKHFPCYWPFVQGIHRPPVNSLHKGQWCRALMFS